MKSTFCTAINSHSLPFGCIWMRRKLGCAWSCVLSHWCATKYGSIPLLSSLFRLFLIWPKYMRSDDTILFFFSLFCPYSSHSIRLLECRYYFLETIHSLGDVKLFLWKFTILRRTTMFCASPLARILHYSKMLGQVFVIFQTFRRRETNFVR